MRSRDEQLRAATAAFCARRIPRGLPVIRQGATMAHARAEAFRAFADVEVGEAEALLRVELSA